MISGPAWCLKHGRGWLRALRRFPLITCLRHWGEPPVSRLYSCGGGTFPACQVVSRTIAKTHLREESRDVNLDDDPLPVKLLNENKASWVCAVASKKRGTGVP